jgi:hypothetical protein
MNDFNIKKFLTENKMTRNSRLLNETLNMDKIKGDVLKYLKYERDDRVPDTIKQYGGDEEYVRDEILGSLETVLDGKTDNDLVNLINQIFDKEGFEQDFLEFKEYMGSGYSDEELYTSYAWEDITNP